MKQQKPFEDLACIQLNAEIVGHLPQELRDRLLAYFAVRNLYSYKGPTRHLRLVDNEALPIASLLCEMRELTKENLKLAMENNRLKAADNEAQQAMRFAID